MSLTSDHFVTAHQSAADAAHAFGRIAIDGAERLLVLQLAAARALLEARHGTVQTLLDARNPQEIAALGRDALRPEGERLVGYARAVYDSLARTQEEWLQQVERQQAGWHQSVGQWLDAYARTAPGGADVAVAALRTAVNAANSTFDSVHKAARQVANIAEAGVAAAADASVRAVAPATPPAGRRKAA